MNLRPARPLHVEYRMKAHALNGDSTSAFNVLLEMRSLNIKPRIRDYNIVLKACATEGSEEEEEEEKELTATTTSSKTEMMMQSHMMG